mgnify:CR=1 FL=1
MCIISQELIVTYLSQISFGIITSSRNSHVLVATFSWLISFKLFARYLKTVSRSDGLSPSRKRASLRRVRWLRFMFIVDFLYARNFDGFFHSLSFKYGLNNTSTPLVLLRSALLVVVYCVLFLIFLFFLQIRKVYFTRIFL